VLGTPASADALVYEEKDPGFFTGVGKTLSDRFFVIETHDHETSEVYLIDTATPEAGPRLIAPRQKGVEYDVEHWEDQLIIRTNADDAEDFKIVTAPLSAPGKENWRDLIAHRPGCLVLGIIAFKAWLVRLERENGLPRIVVREMRSGAEHEIAFAEEAYALGFGQMLEYDTDILRFSYSSMTTPAEIYDYDMRQRTRVLRKRQEVPSGHEPANYVTRRIQAPADDGETVPVTLLYRKETQLDGSAPLWLYGYGSYGITIPASFNTNILSLVDRGFIYAIAHIRGGQDKGYRWYTEGKREKKQNTFHDFISAARHLIATGYTREAQIVAQGGSAGGMLVGAVANMAPELFKAIIAEVPFVDVLTTMLDDTLPLTPPEWTEWGNPLASKEAYDVIAAYSPYDHVTAKAYPNILAVGGLTDPRVTYWEPAKWVARLRDRKTDQNLLLLKTQMEAGHGGAPGRFDRLKEVALVYAFGLMVTKTIEGRS
jgi:oligopeptidase B